MTTLTINLKQFKDISFEECLNYSPHSKVESIIGSNTRIVVQNLKSDNYNSLSISEKLKIFLETLLLRIAVHQNWIESRDTYDLDQQYLYTVIKRYLLLEYPELLN